MKRNKQLLISYKLLFGLLGFSAIVTEIAILTERGTFEPVNFFSYLTIETNILVFITLLFSALAKNGKLDELRSAVAVYILIVGIGFSWLLAGLKNMQFAAVPWDNTVFHYIMPIAVAIDLLIDRPKRQLPFRRALLWLLFPIAYVGYSLIRGAITGWYPYDFLNPMTNGYLGVAMTIGELLVVAIVLIWIVNKISARKVKS